MIRLFLLRHGPTAASREHRLQGRSDPPLDAAGRAEVLSWQLPEFARALRWYRSPLRRCAETAALLRLEATPAPALVEMDWGDWEGRRVQDLRAADAGFAVEEARGLDLRPPGGESPRQVQHRLVALYAKLAIAGHDAGGISHKGVIRATLALATGWDMRGKPPVRLGWDRLQQFRVEKSGKLSLERENIPIVPG